MIIRRYEKSDFAQISSWAKDWGAEYSEDQFPEIGFIVDGVAAYFLYQTDSLVCFLENLISNKHANKEDRDSAVDGVINAVFKEAHDRGYVVAYATTDNPRAVVRAMIHGACAIPKHTLLIKKLTDPSL